MTHQTHEVSIDHERGVVVKHYSAHAPAEAAREWRALGLLAEHAPRLAPEPISADLEGRSPQIVMSLLPGDPLGGRQLTEPQERALALAIGRLWQAVPVGLITPLPAEVEVHARFERLVRDWAAVTVPGAVAEPVVRDALAAGTAWLAGAEVLTTGATTPAMPGVLGQGDANMANFLWDGELVRIVDFDDSGISDRAFELAILVEHISAWRDSGLVAEQFTAGFGLSTAERARLADWRRLAAFSWLLRLRSRGDPGALQGQARRLLALL